MNNLTIVYEVEAKCDDCGCDIEEAHWYNQDGKEVHFSTSGLNGHYFLDGSIQCGACYDGSR